MADEPYDASDRGDVREAAKLAKSTATADLGVTADIMRTTAGRGWMYRKLGACHVHQTTFTGNALQSAFCEGERNIGLMLEAEILQACPDEFILMLREANERSITSDSRRNNRKRGGNGTDEAGSGNYVNYEEPGDSQVERE